MPRNLLALVSNTFTETLRQPVYGVIIGGTILLLVFSPSLVMFTMDDDNQLLRDIGLSTLMMAGLLLAVFSASTVVTEEIENRTVLTVVSKTVSRSTFVLGKFLGIAGAVLLAMYLLGLVLMMVVRHGVMQTARDEPDMVVITLGTLTAVVTLIVGLAGNYFYNWRFGATAVVLGSLLSTVVIGVLSFVNAHWQYDPQPNNLPYQLLGPIILVMIAEMILTGLAVAAAIRLNMVTTLIVCTLTFLAGVMVPYWLGPLIARGGFWALPARAIWALVPNINHYVVTNAVYENLTVPLSYIGETALYALLYVSGALLFAMALFRGRQLG